IRPAWETARPAWVPDEFLWAWGGSYTGMPTATARVRNVWSASMAVRREVFAKVAGFRAGFGKVGARARPADPDLCLRTAAACAGVPFRRSHDDGRRAEHGTGDRAGHRGVRTAAAHPAPRRLRPPGGPGVAAGTAVQRAARPAHRRPARRGPAGRRARPRRR